MIYGIVYKATNLNNNKKYIGQTTTTISNRKNNHLTESKSKKRGCPLFFNALRKNGIKNFKWETISECYSREDLDKSEEFWITYYKTTNRDKGYNIHSGGRGKKKIIDLNKIKKLYNQGLSNTNIGKKLNLNRTTIGKHLKIHFGISNISNIKILDEQKLKELFHSGLNNKKMCKELKCSKSHLYKYVKKLNLKRNIKRIGSRAIKKETKLLILNLRKRGEIYASISKKTNLHRNTIGRIIRDSDFNLSGNIKTFKREQSVIDLFNKNLSDSQIQEELSCSLHNVRNTLKKNNLRRIQKISLKTSRLVKEYKKQGMTNAKISNILKISTGSVGNHS